MTETDSPEGCNVKPTCRKAPGKQWDNFTACVESISGKLIYDSLLKRLPKGSRLSQADTFTQARKVYGGSPKGFPVSPLNCSMHYFSKPYNQIDNVT